MRNEKNNYSENGNEGMIALPNASRMTVPVRCRYGVMATPKGLEPTVMVAMTVLEAVAITETLSES